MDALLEGVKTGKLPKAESDSDSEEPGPRAMPASQRAQARKRQAPTKELLPPPVRPGAASARDERSDDGVASDLLADDSDGDGWEEDWTNEEASSTRAKPSPAMLAAMTSQPISPADLGEQPQTQERSPSGARNARTRGSGQERSAPRRASTKGKGASEQQPVERVSGAEDGKRRAPRSSAASAQLKRPKSTHEAAQCASHDGVPIDT